MAQSQARTSLNASRNSGLCPRVVLAPERSGLEGDGLCPSRYYDHKRHAARKTQKTVEASEKVLGEPWLS